MYPDLEIDREYVLEGRESVKKGKKYINPFSGVNVVWIEASKELKKATSLYSNLEAGAASDKIELEKLRKENESLKSELNRLKKENDSLQNKISSASSKKKK